MPKFSKGHNSGNIWWIFFSKFNQVINLSSPISWPSFKLLAQIVFNISCWQVYNVLICKGPTSRNIWRNFIQSWSGNLPIIPYQLTKFQAPSSNCFRDILLTSFKWPNLQRAITLAKIEGIHSKVYQVIYSSSPNQMTKFQTHSLNNFRDSLLTSLKYQNFQWAITL